MRSFLLNVLTVAASLIVGLLAFEGVLRFLPVAQAPPVQPPTASDPIQRYAPNESFTWSLGWNFAVVSRGRTNAQGFVADYDYDANARTPLVAVLGDSYIEALMVPFRDTLTGRLQSAFGNTARAYAFAQAGSPLSQYVAYARHACAYRPDRIVVTIVGNDFDESLYARRGRDGIHHLHPRADGGFDLRLTPAAPSGLLRRVARNSALARYVVRNLNIGLVLYKLGIGAAQAAETDKYAGNTAIDASPARIAEGQAVIDWFLAALPAACLSPREITLVIDAIRPHVYDPGQRAWARNTYFGRMRESLMAKGRAAGFTVVDMEPLFADSYARDKQPFEHPEDGHWNAQGHAVAAEGVSAALGTWPR